jgi:hypothetical protein
MALHLTWFRAGVDLGRNKQAWKNSISKHILNKEAVALVDSLFLDMELKVLEKIYPVTKVEQFNNEFLVIFQTIIDFEATIGVS